MRQQTGKMFPSEKIEEKRAGNEAERQPVRRVPSRVSSTRQMPRNMASGGTGSM